MYLSDSLYLTIKQVKLKKRTFLICTKLIETCNIVKNIVKN